MTEKERPLQQDQFFYPVREYLSEASRIKYFQELSEYDLKVPKPMYILGHNAFRHWQEHGLDETLKDRIGEVYQEVKKGDPDRWPYIGRAFCYRGNSNPNGPRTAGIKSKEEYISRVVEFWDFVVKRKYDVKEEADIALVLHPFIDAWSPRLVYGRKPIKEKNLPWSGGYIVSAPEPGKGQQVMITVNFGPDETVQSCPADVIKVDPESGIITAKIINLKTDTLKPLPGTSIYPKVATPVEWQSKQALTDEEALMVAREAHKVFSKNPNKKLRLEFIIQKDGVYIREIAPYKSVDKHSLFKFEPGETMVGPVVRVGKESDIERIFGSEAIVHFGPEAFRERTTTDLFAKAAALKDLKRKVALVYGTPETSHLRVVLEEAGWSIILTGDQEFTDGVDVKISCGEDYSPRVEFVNPYHQAVIPFENVGELFKGVAGNKVANLSRMRAAGFLVPDGFAISSTAIWKYLMDIGLYEKIMSLDRIALDNGQEMKGIVADVRNEILEKDLPRKLEDRILKAVKRYGFDKWSIRSSGGEDEEGRSRAGRYESSTDVPDKEVISAIKKTIVSYFSEQGIKDIRREGKLPSRMPVGVGMHQFIPNPKGSIGAVVFTDEEKILIEMRHGSPDKLVKGIAKDIVKISIERQQGARIGEVSWKVSGEPKLKKTDIPLDDLIELVERIERLFGKYQDIELIITPEGEMRPLQARPR